MEDSNRIKVFFISSLFEIAFWTWFYYNISTIIEILIKNIWMVGFLFIINWIVPSIYIYFRANSLNKNVSFSKSLVASLLSNVVYSSISLIIFFLFPYINQVLVIPILLIIAITLPIIFIIIYAYIFQVNWMDAFKIASTYAFISIITIISTFYVITYVITFI